MAITQCQRQKQIVLVCFENSLSLLVQVDQANAEGTLWAAYPVATNLVYLPDSFLPIVNFLQYKANGSTYYQNIIKKALIQSCTNFTEGFDALCNEHFPTQRLVVDWCINIIINNNNMMSWWLKIKYICAANDAKKHWLVRRQSWLQQEQYLNGNDFRAELNRSNAEFFEEVRKAIGCAPKRWHPIN
jgi:hypothetical protein